MIRKKDNCQKNFYWARAAFAALICVFLFNTSCSNLFEPVISDPPQTAGTSNSGVAVVNFTGSFETSLPNGGAVPSELSALYRNDNSAGGTDARNAKPNLPTGLTYTVTAETVETASDGTNPAKTSTGTVNASTSTFNIPLVTGYKWKITVTALSGTTPLLSDTYTMPSVLSPDSLNISYTFVLKPLSSGNGSVTLSFTEPETSLYDDVAITAVSCSNTGGAGPSTWQGGLSSGTISLTGIASGNYFVTIDFKKGGELVFSTTQTIIVYPNLTTNTWVSGGGSLDPINNSGQFQVTAALVELFKRTQFFVGKPSDGSAGSDTSGDGSAANPYATVGKALEKISQSGSGSVDYTIRISGTASENVVVSSTATNAITTSKARSITILGQRGLNASGVPQDILNGTGNDSVLTIATTVPITIRNLKITGGEANNGGGINIASGAKVTLANGAVVTGNNATYTSNSGGGGGVYNAGTLFMYGSAVIGDASVETAATSTTQCSNYASYGGGLFNAVGATAYLGYSAENTTAGLTGGIYYNYAKGECEGGGIYNAGIIFMDSGNVSYNCSSGYSGGVSSCDLDGQNGTTFTLSGGTISHNQTSPTRNDLYGGGIRVWNGYFNMTGGEISENWSNNGGGVSLIRSVEFTFTGGIIKDNTASNTDQTARGSGILFEQGSMKMGGSAVVDAGNDIWLNSGSDVATVTVYSSLTGDSPVATLTPGDYSRTSALVAAGSGVTLANETGKFAVTSNGSNDYVLDSQGKLKLGTMVSPSSVENLILEAGESYNLVLSSDFTEDNLITLMTNIENSSVSEVTLDFSNTSMTQLGDDNATWLKPKITSVTLPSNVQEINGQEFESAVDLTEILLPGGENEYFSVENGILYDKNKTKLVMYPPSKSGDEYTLPNTVTTLGSEAFRNNKNLVRINGLEEITQITGDDVFCLTQKLVEIDLSGLTGTILNGYTFNSSHVKKIILSSSITSFGSSCFNGCSQLQEIHFKNSSPPSLTISNILSNCNSNLKFYVPKGSKSEYLNATGSSGFAGSNNPFASSLAARVFEEDPEVLNMLYVQGAYFDGSSAVTDSAVFIADRELIIPDLYVSDHEVTQTEYQAVMGTNPSNFQGVSNPPATGEIQANRPVERISWYDAIMYCNKRSSDENLTRCYAVNGEIDQSQWGYTPNNGSSISGTITCDLNADGYRLPTEAEWEYIARGGNGLTGTQYSYSGSNTVGDVAWTTETITHEVKKKPANSLGIYDMTGNVYEWCWDFHGTIYSYTPTTGPTAANGSNREIRGGSYCTGTDCTVSRRFLPTANAQSGERGFRVVRSLSYSFHDYVTMLPAGTPGSAGTEDTSYALFGDWPQTLKTSSVTVDENQTLTRGGFTYFKGSDGNWYAKQQEKAYATGYVYADETTPVAQSSAGSYKYFKVEPIKWRVLTTEFDHDGLSTTDGKKLLLAENILIVCKYNESDNNAYDVSTLRSYLSGGFYNTAFTSALKTMILTTTSANDAESACIAGSDYVCDPTEDKVFALSQAEATSYGFNSDGSTDDSTRVRKPTDFAMASGVYTDQYKGGKWWLRSPAQYNTTKQLVTSTGSMTVDHGWESGVAAGIVPALCLND